jgi:hypothetical protein
MKEEEELINTRLVTTINACLPSPLPFFADQLSLGAHHYSVLTKRSRNGIPVVARKHDVLFLRCPPRRSIEI